MISSRLDALAPDVPARWALLSAVCTVIGVAVAGRPVLVVVLPFVAVAALARRHRVVAATIAGFIVAGVVSGSLATARLDATRAAIVPATSASVTFTLVEDASSNRYGVSIGELTAIEGVPWHGPRVAVIGSGDAIDVGAHVEAIGRLAPGVRRVRDEIVAGTFTIGRVTRVVPSRNPMVIVGNLIRERVQSAFDGEGRSDGLTTGLLIGDTRLLGAHDTENLRRAGLAHFVAVSGSNVAVFMLGWWIVTAPVSIRPRLRAALGFVGLGVFIVITRWEPSVVRASVMTAVPLAGAIVSIPVDPWMALGTAVTVLLLVSGDLLSSVGFQLSVAATAGVLLGVTLARGRKPQWVWTSLLVTVFAQLAVAPIILTVFGSVPLWAPAANLVVAPIVTAATVAGGVSLIIGAVEPLASVLSSLVLLIAQWASLGPQLGALGVVAATFIGGLVAYRTTRALGIVVALIVVVAGAGSPSIWPDTPSVTALDVGQGDAILIQDPSGAAMLIDGGSDPGVIDRALRRHGVTRLDIIVATHGDADHVGGLAEVVTSFDVESLWVSAHAAPSDLLTTVLEAAASRGTRVLEVEAGVSTALGETSVEVVSPARRFASDNDGSITIVASASLSVLVPGDIEAIGQKELPDLHPDIVIVPHHGSASTDPRWLADVVSDIAIVSYGANTYGHPNPEIMATLREAGAEIRETFVEGDITVSLSKDRWAEVGVHSAHGLVRHHRSA
jgi:competence protein ComEC